MRYFLVLLWFFVVIASFSYFHMPGEAKPLASNERYKTIKCYEQKIVTLYMKKKRFKILFNWMSEDGKLIKLVAANSKANILLVHITDSEEACIIDEFGNGTTAPNMFFEMFGLIRNTFNKPKSGY